MDPIHALTTPSLSRAAPGVDSGLELLVADHYPRLIRLARLVCRDGSDAADAVQAGLEQAWRHREAVRDPGALRPWLDRIVVREAIRVARSRRSWFSRMVRIDDDSLPLPRRDPGDTAVADRAVLEAAFARLTPEQRSAVALHLYAGYPVAETAVMLDVPIETMRSRLKVARARLRDELGSIDR